MEALMTLGMVLIILGTLGTIFFVRKGGKWFMTCFVTVLIGMLVTIYPFVIKVLDQLQY